MIYGLDYCASEECYINILDRIKEEVLSIEDIEFYPSKEIARVNKVDPLGITYLRVRGMWGIENPWKVFRYIYKKDNSKAFNFMCIINDNKWKEFENTGSLESLLDKVPGLTLENVLICDPDNPAELSGAKLITYIK